MSKNNIIEFENEINKLNSLIKEQADLFEAVGVQIKKSYVGLPSELLKQLKEQNNLEIQAEKLRQESIKSQQKLEELAKKQIQTARESQRLTEQNSKNENRLLKEKESQNARTMKSHNDFVNAINRQKKAQDQANKAQERQNTLITEASRPYVKLQAKWREAQKNLADLVVSQGANAKATVLQRKEFELLDKQIRSVDSITKNYSKNVGNYSSAITGGLGSLMGAFGIVGGVTAGISVLKDAFDIIREFDSQMINVQKTTGLTTIELDLLKDSVVDLSKELGFVSSSKLGEYMAVAGQLGVKGRDNLLNFTEAMAKLEVTSTIAGEQGASEMARFLTLVDGGVQNVKAFGNEVVILGNNFAATEGEILSNATRIAQSTGVYNLGRQQVLAYATATKAVGVEAELVGSTMGRTLGIFEKSIRTGKNLESITKVLGTTQSELSERFKRDASGVLMDYIGALNKTFKAGGSVNAQLESIGITAVRDQAVISSLATKGFEPLQDAMLKVGEAGNAMSDEFDSASKKINNRIASLSTSWDNFILNIDKGDGAISAFVIRSINSLEKLINVLDRLNSSWSEIWEKAYSQGEKTGTEQAEKFLSQTKETEKRLEAMQKVSEEIKTMQTDIADLREKERKITEGSFFNKLTSKGVRFYQKDIEEKENYLGQLKGFMSRLQEENSKEALFFGGFANEETAANVGGDKKDLSKSEMAKRKKAEEERLSTIFNTRKIELDMEAEHNKNIGLINARNYEERQATQLQYNLDRLEIAKIEYNEEVKLAQGNNEKLLLAKAKHLQNIQKLEADNDKINKEVQEKQFQDSLKLVNMIEDNEVKNTLKSDLLTAKTEQEKLNIRLKYLEKQKEIIDRNEQQEIESGKHTANELLVVLEEFNQKRVELDQEANDIVEQQAEKTAKMLKSYIEQFSDMGVFGFSSLNIFTTIEENGNTMFENLYSNAVGWKKKMAVIVGSVGEVFMDVMGAMQDASKARFDNEMQQLQASYEVSLLFAGDSTAAKEKLEEEFAMKQKEIRKKQAESDKKYAIMGALINTAQAVVSVLAQEPGGLIKKGIAAAIVGGLGLAQVATIASTPIPEFWMGTDNAPQGWALTQEMGAEVITDKKGNVKTMGNNKGAQLTFLESGDKVFKSREDYFKSDLANTLNSSGISHNINVDPFDYDRFDGILAKNTSNTNVNMVFDEDGFNYRTEKRNVRQRNKKYNARG